MFIDCYVICILVWLMTVVVLELMYRQCRCSLVESPPTCVKEVCELRVSCVCNVSKIECLSFKFLFLFHSIYSPVNVDSI